MKKKILVIVTAVVMALVCVMGLIACGGNDEIEGTYYSYSNGEKVEGFSMKLEGGKATVTSMGRYGPETSNGTYKVDGNKVTVTITADGSTLTQTFTVVSDGVLKYNDQAYYCKDGKTPPAIGSPEKPPIDDDTVDDNPDDDDSDDNSEKPTLEFVMPQNGFDMSEQIDITFYHTMYKNLRNVLDIYIERFNELFPNINVNHKQVGGYDDVCDRIETEITAGKQPNLAYCYPDHVALFNRSNAVLPLNEFLHNGEYKDMTIKRADGATEALGFTKEQKESFFEDYYNEGFQFGDGKTMYTLPLVKSMEVMYYNKTFFEENNIEVPTTWDEMEQVCARIKEIDSKCTPLGYDSQSNWFITMCEQYGSPYTSATGKKYLFNNDTNKKFVTRFKGWYDNGYVVTQSTNGNAYTSDLFKEQKIYMCIGSSAGAGYQMPDRITVNNVSTRKFEVGIAPIPQANPDNPKAITHGPSICIFKNEDPQKVLASWLFAKFLTTSIDFQAVFSFASGYAPVIKTVTENENYQDYIARADGYDNLMSLAAKVCMEQANACFTSPAFVGSSKARDEVGELMRAVFIGSKTVDKAFKDAIEECENYADEL